MLNLLRTVSIFMCLVTCSNIANATARNDLGPHVSGTWEMVRSDGFLERLTMTWSATREQGRFTNVKIYNGRQVERLSGRWTIRSNPLLRPESRTQLHLVWDDPRWGRRNRKLAIRRVTTQQLKFANILNSAEIITFRRISE